MKKKRLDISKDIPIEKTSQETPTAGLYSKELIDIESMSARHTLTNSQNSHFSSLLACHVFDGRPRE